MVNLRAKSKEQRAKNENNAKNIKIKICGITNLEDALNSVKAGCNALGFMFYRKSPRYLTPKKASRIIKHIPAHILKIGVFVNAKEKTIKRIAKLCSLDMLQFHGNESPEFCNKFKGYKIIKAFRVHPVRNTTQIKNNKKVSNGVKDRIKPENLLNYKTFAYLFDTFVKSKMGGTGKKFNWTVVRHLGGFRKPIFLSGGLNAKNVKEAIRKAHPDWVDVSSSVEIKPGKKDYKKVKEFIEIVRKPQNLQETSQDKSAKEIIISY